MIKFPKETNMEGLKKLALSLLYLDIQKTTFSPMVVTHPFTNTGLTAQVINGEVRMLNLMESEDDLEIWQNGLENIINEAKKPHDIYFLINKPYALAFVKFAMPYLSQKVFSTLLSDAWIKSENPNHDPNFTSKKLVSLFKAADKTYLMEKRELQTLENLDDEITIYRGVGNTISDNTRKMSWTLDADKADWFANRYGNNGMVYKAKIDKSHVLAYFGRRGESEVLVEPQYLQEIQLYDDYDEVPLMSQ